MVTLLPSFITSIRLTYWKFRGRFGHPDEVAAGVVFTAMDSATFMTGSDWGPDGGYQIA